MALQRSITQYEQAAISPHKKPKNAYEANWYQRPDAEKPTFEGREVVLGPRASNHYIVKLGLAEGEIVVTNGNFKIDSALQIQAKPSMMNPEGQKAPMGSGDHSH